VFRSQTQEEPMEDRDRTPPDDHSSSSDHATEAPTGPRVPVPAPCPQGGIPRPAPQPPQYPRESGDKRGGRQATFTGTYCPDDNKLRLYASNGELHTKRVRIESLRAIEGEASLLGTVYLFGVLHHAWFVRVEEQDGDQVAVDDPHGRLEEFQQLDADGGAMQTVAVPGYPGEYVLVIYPAGQ
jgi:hypothetical protein